MTAERRRAEIRGRWAERLAALCLRLQGFRILAARYRTPVGEIDLVGRRGRLLVFVEVKARADLDQALHAVGAVQRRRTVRAASIFLGRHPRHADCTVRFDVIAVRPWRLPHHLADAWRSV